MLIKSALLFLAINVRLSQTPPPFLGTWETSTRLTEVSGVTAVLVDTDNVHFIGTDYIDKDMGGRENRKLEIFNWKTQTSDVLVQKFGQPGCASGGFLSDGTLVVTGGATKSVKESSTEGLSTEYLRTFKTGSGIVGYDEKKWEMDSFRWYSGAVTTPNGDLLMIGGASANSPKPQFNNPTYEFIGSEGILSPGKRFFQFLEDHKYCDFIEENCALYTPSFLLPSGDIFVMADQDSIIWNPYENKVIKTFPKIPKNHYTYPYNGLVVMLPLQPPNYDPVILACGGNPSSAGRPNLNRKTSAKCHRIRPLTGTKWIEDDPMPVALTIPCAMILADGTIFVNGGALMGEAGYGVFQNGKQQNYGDVKKGQANFYPFIYDPAKPRGSRWTPRLKKTSIARVYHSSSVLLPDGKVLVAGSQPNRYASRTQKPFPTEYRVEYFTPPYFAPGFVQPTITNLDAIWRYAQRKQFNIDAVISKVLVVHQGLSTHSMQFGMRAVFLEFTLHDGGLVKFETPNNSKILPMGTQYYLFAVGADGVPSKGFQISIS